MGKTSNYICSLLSHYLWTIPLVNYVVSYFKNIWKKCGVFYQFREAAKKGDDPAMLNIMSNYGMQCTKFFYLRICHHSFIFPAWNKSWVSIRHDVAGEEVVTALGSEVIRLEKQIRELVPGIQHVDIEAHNPMDQSLWSEKKKVAVLQGLSSSYG